jgi:outer membrane lipoprotein carrier protein
MRKSWFLLIASSLWLVAILAHAAETNGGNSLDHFLDGLKRYSARFQQELLSDDGEVLDKSSGMVYLEKPGKFNWHYYKPYSQYLISDGHNLWIYDEDLEQVTIKNISQAIENSPASILGGDLDIDKYYTVKDLGVTDGVDRMELTPRDSDSQYRAVRLGFKGKHLVSMDLFDNLGQETEIRFTDGSRNPQLDEQLFHFRAPAGVDVIDGRR